MWNTYIFIFPKITVCRPINPPPRLFRLFVRSARSSSCDYQALVRNTSSGGVQRSRKVKVNQWSWRQRELDVKKCVGYSVSSSFWDCCASLHLMIPMMKCWKRFCRPWTRSSRFIRGRNMEWRMGRSGPATRTEASSSIEILPSSRYRMQLPTDLGSTGNDDLILISFVNITI